MVTLLARVQRSITNIGKSTREREEAGVVHGKKKKTKVRCASLKGEKNKGKIELSFC